MSHDNTMSQAEAASFLGVTERTIRNYIKKGLLSKIKAGSRVRIPSEEIISLKEDIDSANPTLSKQEFLRLRAKVRRLESNMEVVLRMLDAKDAPLSLNPEYSSELYSFAIQHLKRGKWEAGEIDPWCDIFDRLSEDDLMTLAKSVDDPHPWRVFLRLCTAMMSSVVGDPEYQTSIDLQTLHRKLSGSRRRLRITSFIYGEMKGDMHKELGGFFVQQTSTDSLFRKILKNG